VSPQNQLSEKRGGPRRLAPSSIHPMRAQADFDSFDEVQLDFGFWPSKKRKLRRSSQRRPDTPRSGLTPGDLGIAAQSVAKTGLDFVKNEDEPMLICQAAESRKVSGLWLDDTDVLQNRFGDQCCHPILPANVVN